MLSTLVGKTFLNATLSIYRNFWKKIGCHFFFDHRFGWPCFLPPRQALKPAFKVSRGCDEGLWKMTPTQTLFFEGNHGWNCLKKNLPQKKNIQIWSPPRKMGPAFQLTPLSMTPPVESQLWLNTAATFCTSSFPLPFQSLGAKKTLQKSCKNPPYPSENSLPTFIQFEAPGWKPEDLLIPRQKMNKWCPHEKKDHVLKRKIQSLPTKIIVQGTC